MSTDGMNDWQAVERPSRYVGGEWNIVVKNHPVASRLLLAFPGTYEIGMSHLGMRILYGLVNGFDDLALERAFCPWPDREAQMREKGEPLCSLETGRPASEFDLIGFSLQSELDFTNILTLLDLAGLPLRAGERGLEYPIIIAGGPVAFNPEPLADFVDLFLIGDAEAQLPALMRAVAELRRSAACKAELLRDVSTFEGVYAPAIHRTEADPDNGLLTVCPPTDERQFVRKAMVENLDDYPFPADVIVPYCDIVHDRVAVEISRGCSRGCRFCQAGVIYLPERQRSAGSIVETINSSLKSTGYRDVSLTALTPNDFVGLRPMVGTLMENFRREGVSLSFASLSPSGVDSELLELVAGVRKTGLTIAPEAGTQRMRDVINKGVTEADILNTAKRAFDLGWKLLKLYFMIGLPTETDEDVLGIAELAGKVAAINPGVKVKIGVSNFVPKSHTPFQWVPMDTGENLQRKQMLIRDALRGSRVVFKAHDVYGSLLEGVFSRGDRKVGKAVEAAWRLGCRHDGWAERLHRDLWRQAFAETGIEPESYLHSLIPPYSNLPWSHIDTLVKVDFLREEYQRSLGARTLIRCMPKNCPACRACTPALLKQRWNPGRRAEQELVMASPGGVDGEPVFWRFCYEKGEALRTLGHLDLSRLVSRVFRRAGLKVKMSQGFHPQPRISFGPALPLGITGKNEYLDAVVIGEHDAQNLLSLLNGASPDGLLFKSLARVEGKPQSLSASLVAADYSVQRLDGKAFNPEALSKFLARETMDWVRIHKGKRKKLDIRAAVLSLDNANSWSEIKLRLSLEGGLKARPAEVILAAFDLDSGAVKVVRNQLFIRTDGDLRPPLE